MSKTVDSLGLVTRAVQNAIFGGTVRAINKAAAKTFTKVKRDLREDTGLTNKVIEKRVLVSKANKNKITASVNVATQFDVQLSEFSPKEKKVSVNRRTYYGVTVKVGTEGRQIVPGGFLRTVNSGKQLILSRTSNSRYPIQALKSDIVKVSALARQEENSAYMRTEFDRLLDTQVTYELDKYINK